MIAGIIALVAACALVLVLALVWGPDESLAPRDPLAEWRRVPPPNWRARRGGIDYL